MAYLTWLARLLFGAWMVSNGLMHFIHLWPQPMGSVPLSKELTAALIDSRLFIGVKAIEVIAGFSILTGIYAPLVMLVCLPVSFVVAYYGEFLEGSRTHTGLLIVFVCNLIICLGYWKNYKAMFTLRAQPRTEGLSLTPVRPAAPAE